MLLLFYIFSRLLATGSKLKLVRIVSLVNSCRLLKPLPHRALLWWI